MGHRGTGASSLGVEGGQHPREGLDLNPRRTLADCAGGQVNTLVVRCKGQGLDGREWSVTTVEEDVKSSSCVGANGSQVIVHDISVTVAEAAKVQFG